MKKSRVVLALLLSAILAFAPGCGSMMFRNPESVLVTSNVQGAAIFEGSKGQGKAPGSITLDRSADHILTVQAEGYAPETVRVTSHLSWWRILTSIVLNGGHGLFTLFISTGVGIAIDVGAGSWQYLEPDEVHVELHKTGEAPAPEQTPDQVQPTAAPVKPAARFCGSCGTKVDAGTRFCPGCGGKQ